MSFSKNEIPPIMQKILDAVECETLTSSKMYVNDFKTIATKIRISQEDIDKILQFLQQNGYIDRRGKIIYRNYDTNAEEINTTNHPGRPRKLTDEEIKWVKDNYEPRKFSIRKIAEVLNEKRKKDDLGSVHWTTIQKTYL